MATAPAQPAPTTDRTPAKKPNVVVQTQAMINGFLNKGTLALPGDYSPENALKSAWLILQTVQDRDKRPALEVCTEASIINALLDMVIQGLNPAKKQCYFIVYGKSLTCQRSYFGDQALAQRVDPGIEIFSGVVYEGDEFSIEIARGRKSVSHKQKLENIDNDKIVAAYCGIVDANGEELGTEVMTWEQITQSWGMSKTYNPGQGTHGDFPDQMALRTVIRRRCKPIINKSNDALLREAVQRQEMNSVDASIDAEAAELANRQSIGVESKIVDAEFHESPVSQDDEPKKETPAPAAKAAEKAPEKDEAGF